MLERIKELSAAREDFGFETTLSGRGYARLLTEMRQIGYRVVLFFLWLPSADLAVERVANRVQQGGHNVPDADVRRRFASGLRNLFHLYRPRLDVWWMLDACCLPPALIAAEEDGVFTANQADLFDQIQRQV
jgi:predicted ABC-type ATPase